MRLEDFTRAAEAVGAPTEGLHLRVGLIGGTILSGTWGSLMTNDGQFLLRMSNASVYSGRGEELGYGTIVCSFDDVLLVMSP
jgi:hypothetical protein